MLIRPTQKSCLRLKSPPHDGKNIRTPLFSFSSQNYPNRIIVSDLQHVCHYEPAQSQIYCVRQ